MLQTKNWGWNEGKLGDNFWRSKAQLDNKSGRAHETATFCDDSNEPKSMPSFSKNSNIYCFEVGSSKSSTRNSVASLTRSNSTLSFSSQSKKYDWGMSISERTPSSDSCWNLETSTDDNKTLGGSSSCLNTPYGSSNSLSLFGSSCEKKKHLDWSGLVDNVFKEEIGKLADKFHGGHR